MVNVSRSLTNINSVFASPHKDYGGSCRTSLIGGLCFRIVLNNLFIKMMEIQNIQSKLVQKRFFEYRIRGQAEGMYTLRTFLGIQSLSSVHMFDMTADAYRYEKLILYVDNGEILEVAFYQIKHSCNRFNGAKQCIYIHQHYCRSYSRSNAYGCMYCFFKGMFSNDVCNTR